MYPCTCGYQAADQDELYDHLAEAFTPAGDQDAGSIVHAEAARDKGDVSMPYRCLCGHEAGDTVALDAHLLRAFTPASRIGLDGARHDVDDVLARRRR